MFADRIVAVSAMVVLFVGRSALADFKPGNVFLSDPSFKFCMNGDTFGWDVIWQVDPQTGEVSQFAELADESCGFITGLAFTPDGKGLRVSSLLNDRILEFASDGTFTVVLDASDGIGNPRGSNNIAYDAAENFYVVNSSPRNIMRFPAKGGPGVVIADNADGIGGSGHIAIASDGDLYFMNNSFGQFALRVPRDGPISLFDEYEDIITGVAADDDGHIFVGVRDTAIYRYDAGDPDSIEELVSGPLPFSLNFRMTMSEDNSHLYVSAVNKLFAVDPTDGTITLIAELTDASLAAGGIAVVPAPRDIPTMSDWGLVVMMFLFVATGAVVLHRRDG